MMLAQLRHCYKSLTALQYREWIWGPDTLALCVKQRRPTACVHLPFAVSSLLHDYRFTTLSHLHLCRICVTDVEPMRIVTQCKHWLTNVELQFCPLISSVGLRFMVQTAENVVQYKIAEVEWRSTDWLRWLLSNCGRGRLRGFIYEGGDVVMCRGPQQAKEFGISDDNGAPVPAAAAAATAAVWFHYQRLHAGGCLEIDGMCHEVYDLITLLALNRYLPVNKLSLKHMPSASAVIDIVTALHATKSLLHIFIHFLAVAESSVVDVESYKKEELQRTVMELVPGAKVAVTMTR